MTDTAARMRTFRASTAAWAANNIVLGSGELGIEVVDSTDIRIKVGDGTTAFGSLPYASASSTTINTATQTALDAKVAKSGDTMTGLLILSGDAVADLGAVTKQQLDAEVDTLTTSISGKLSTSGGTLTGDLTLNADPSSAMHAVTKQYADTAIALKVSKSGDTMTGPLVLPGSPTNTLEAATKGYVDSGAWAVSVGGTSGQAGKGVRLGASGLIDSSMLPISGSYLGPIDLTATYALSGSFGVGSYYALSDTGTIDGSWSTHLNGSPTTCDAGQSIIYNANGKWDLVGDTTSSAAIAGKLDKAGGTMTGALILAADPATALGAATKQYADTMLPKAGGTMTGAIILSGAPSTGLNPATKTYVDTGDALALQAASNLSDLASAATARTNLGGTTVGKAVFVATDAAAARTAIGLGTSAVLDKATAAQFRNGTADKALTPDVVWDAADPVGLTWTSGGTTAVDLNSGLNFTLAASAGNSTLGAPSNAKAGQSGFIKITQDTTPRTLAYASAWVFDGGTDPALSTGSGAVDILYYTVISESGPVVHGTLRKAVA